MDRCVVCPFCIFLAWGDIMKRLISLILIVLLVFNLAACKGKDEPVDTPVVEEDATPSSVELPEEVEVTGFELNTDEEGPSWTFDMSDSSDWDQAKPYINPLGTYDSYSDYGYDEDGYFYLEYLNDDYNLFEVDLRGPVFTLHIPFDETLTNEENLKFTTDFGAYIEGMGGNDFGMFESKHIVNLKDSEGDLWWAYTELFDDTIVMTVIEEDILSVGEVMTVDLDDRGIIDFSIEQDEATFTSLTVNFNGDVYDGNLSFIMRNKDGDYDREYRQGYSFSDYVGPNYTLTDLPNESGLLRCIFDWHTDATEGEATITLNKMFDQTGDLYGENLGAIKVSSEYIYSCSVEKTNHYAYLTHPDYNEEKRYMDKTPDGDFMILVPAGYWDVRLYPQDARLISDYSVLGVPVKSGEITLVDVPYSVSSANSNVSELIDAPGIDMHSFTESSDSATYRFALLDRKTSSVDPAENNTQVYENGQPVKISSIERVNTPPDVYLLLDSSGSMKGQMNGVLSAARVFIENMQDDAKITVVDFDSTVKVLDGNSKTEALSNLNKLSVGGDTALYQATVGALGHLSQSSRPIIVAFTDGENDLKDEYLTEEDVYDSISNQNIPIFTIGFGKNHDNRVLKEMSDLSHGKYFNAEDQEALSQVFVAINERLSNTFELTYKRPEKAGIGDTPVLTFLVDTSGSMSDVDEGYGERMHNLKELLKPFIMTLPEEYRVQVMGFNDQSYYVQSLTGDKRKMILGVDRLIPGGGTEINTALEGAIMGLKNLASTKKVLVFVTDEAMDSSDDFFQEQVKALNDEGVKTLWVGFGNVEVHEDFMVAAELSGGEYLLSSDPDEMEDKINDLMKAVEALPDSELSEVSMVIEKEDAVGNIESFGISQLVTLSPLKISDEIMSVNAIREYPLGSVSQYDTYTTQLITGASIPKNETVISGRLPVNKSRSSEALSIEVKDIFYMDKLNNVEAPSGHQYIGLNLNLENVLKEQKVLVYPDGSNHPSSFVAGPNPAEEVMMIPDYLIQDFKQHFFLDVNNNGGIGASYATYLTEKPIAAPGRPEIFIMGKESKEGLMVFVVPNESVNNMVLHFYDTAYGHIHVPVIGTLSGQEYTLETLPKGQPQKLSDAFELSLSNVEDYSAQNAYGEIVESLVMREVTGVFRSNVQALLTLDPKERIKLEIMTEEGNYYFDIHPKTANVPFGHLSQKMMAPGGQNVSKWLFEIPKALADAPSNLILELAGGDFVMPLTESQSLIGRTPPIYEQEVDMDGDSKGDFKLSILNVTQLNDHVGEIASDVVAVEIVVEDYQDGFSTSGITELLSVVGENESGEKTFVYPADYQNLPLTFKDDTVVYDGTSRRGILIYHNYYENLTLVSPFFEELNVLASSGLIKSYYGIGNQAFDVDERYESAMADALSRIISEYEATELEEPAPVVQVDDSSAPDIPVKSLSAYGRLKMDSVMTIDQMIALMKTIRYVPTAKNVYPFNLTYAPEATVTQGYGTENDMANLALELLSKLGYQPKLKLVTLTDEGKEVLNEYAKTEVYIHTLPAVQYTEEGENHLLVFPFVEDMKDLGGLVYYSLDQNAKQDVETFSYAVNVICENLMPDRMDHMSDFSDAFAGDTEGGPNYESVDVYYGDLPLADLSLEALDMGFQDLGGSYNLAMALGKSMYSGDRRLNKKEYRPVGIEIVLYSNPKTIKKVIWLDDERTLDQYYFTLGINLPDMTGEAIEYLENESVKLKNSVTDYSDFSAVRWYARDILYSLIATQSVEDNRLANVLDLVIGRTNRPRLVLLTMVAPTEDKPLETAIDLLGNNTDVHNGSSVDQHAFNIMSGLFQTQLESYVLGDDGIGAFEIMAMSPEDTGLVFLEPYLDNVDYNAMEDAGVPDHLISYFSDSGKYSMIMEKPATINGQTRWAWIEIDPKTYETIGVTDTLSHGAMAERSITGAVKDIGQYFVGQFIGTTSAMWSVAAFSLIEDDYDVILENARKFALGMKDSFGLKYGKVSMGVGSKPQISQKFMDFKFSFNGKVGISQTIYGFGTGFEDGVNAYFEKAR